MDTLIKEFNNRLHDLDRQRTRALATQQWHKVIALEAKIEEVGTWRKFALGQVEAGHTSLTNFQLKQHSLNALENRVMCPICKNHYPQDPDTIGSPAKHQCVNVDA